MFAKIQEMDNIILTLVSGASSHRLNKFMVFFTNLGSNSAIWILFALPLLMIKKERIAGQDVLIAIAIATLLGEALIKPLVKRARPCEKIPQYQMLIKKPITYSFPSGHTTSSFAAACVLSKYFSIVYFSLPIFVLAAIIGFSRVYLHVHYFSDVLAGVVLGLFCAHLVLYIRPLF